MGSVKNLRVVEEATEDKMGKGFFEFTDDYSVFDYGKMPDTIPTKGEALCRMAAYNFEELEKIGVKTHYKGMPKPNEMEVELVRVINPMHEKIPEGCRNYLLPIEWMFRNQLPPGSSVFKRMDKGELKPEDIGLSEKPTPGEILDEPLIDYSTKLEPTDRYMLEPEAKQMSVVDDEMFEKIKETVLKINSFINRKAEASGLVHADGKVELAIDADGELVLVDVCGTLDENRLLYNNVHISKQVLRDYYRTTSWPQKLDEAFAKNLPQAEWPAPDPLPKELEEIVSNMYKGVCEGWLGKTYWNAPSIEQTVLRYMKFLDQNGK